MAKPLGGYEDGWHEWEAEADDEVKECDDCGTDFAAGDAYWENSDHDRLCADCFEDREDDA